MKSFTASTHLGTVRVRLPDDGPPEVRQNGSVVAQGVPTSDSEDGDHVLMFDIGEFGDGTLMCSPAGQAQTRIVRSLTRGDATLTDTTARHTPGLFAVDGLPPLWGARLNERAGQVRGFTFTDGVQTLETWTVDLVPVKRKCCGRT